MAGSPQIASTSFDPSPQFAIHAIQGVENPRVIVTGRCIFEPVRVGTVFTRVAHHGSGGWEVVGSCHLEVESIGLYHLYVDQLDQTHSARVWLVGSSDQLTEPHESADRLLLVGDPPAEGQWARDGQLWMRTAPCSS